MPVRRKWIAPVRCATSIEVAAPARAQEQTVSIRAVDAHVEVAMLCRLLGDWSDTARTFPAALAAAIGELIDESVLRDGAILPSQRALADALGVARVTVAEAYDLLSAEDLLAARQGSGSRVRSRPGTRLLGSSNTTEGRLASHTGHQNVSIDLTSGALPGLVMVAETLASLDAEDLGDLVAGDGYYPAGLPVLREAIAARYRRDGWPTEPDEVLVTGGAQQAVWLIAHTFVSSGDEVVVEEPTYRGALEAFRACGARFLPVPMAPTGLDVAHLARLLESQTSASAVRPAQGAQPDGGQHAAGRPTPAGRAGAPARGPHRR